MSIFFNAVLPGLILGFLLAQLHYQRKTIHRWRMTMRREHALLQVVDGLGEKLMTGSREAAAMHYGRGMVALLDELHNQERHTDDFWPRVPHPGEPWPDFEPAPAMNLFEGPS